MQQSIVHVALVVSDYDEAIAFYTGKLNFTLVEGSYQPAQDKRWVVVAPPGSTGTTLLLAQATTPEQETAVGNQTGGRVFLFLNTGDFWRDYEEWSLAASNLCGSRRLSHMGRWLCLPICMATCGICCSSTRRENLIVF